MQEGQLLMTQADRDRLVTLRKAKKRLITQRQAAEELGLSLRQVKRLIYALKKRGDKAVIHGLRGKPSNQRIAKTVEEEAIQILSADLYKGFGPTLASEYLADKHDIEVSKETTRQWMIRAKLWRAKEQKVKAVHVWRPRRSRLGELVQWDTSDHDWLEGRGEKLYLIAMIDDATSRLYARFVRHDTTEENMKLLKSYLEKFGRPLAFYTDKASIFRTAEKRKRDEPGVDKDPVEMPDHKRRCMVSLVQDKVSHGAAPVANKSDAPCRSWESPGSRRTVRRRKDEWRGTSARHRIAW
jgi:DNA-binding Lrp family transcriptional regulator